jgi:hypothetical protein
MPDRIAKIEITDPTGVVVQTHTVKYSSNEGNRTVLRIGRCTHVFTNDGEHIFESYNFPANGTPTTKI